MKSNFLFYLLEASMGLSVFCGFYHAVLRGTTFYRISRVYLLITPALALGIPLVQIEPVYAPTPGGVLPAVNWDALAATAVAVQGEMKAKPGLIDYLWVVYWLGSVLFVGLFLLKLARLAMLIRQYRFEDCKGYKLTRTGNTTPTFSFLHYLFWNNAQALSSAEAEAILQHELTHIAEKHTLDILYLECLRSFLWFNPVVCLYRRALQQVHELRADQKVSQQFGKDSYALLLKRTLLRRITLSLSHSFNQSFTKRRIKMLYQPASAPARLWIMLLLLPLTGALSAAFTSRQTPPVLSNVNFVSVDTLQVPPPSVVIKAGKPGQAVALDLKNGFSKSKFPESLTVEAIPDPDYLKQNPEARFAVVEFEVFMARGRRPVKYQAANGDYVSSIPANADWVSIAPFKELAQAGNRLIVEVKRVVRMDSDGRLHNLGQTVKLPVFSIPITE